MTDHPPASAAKTPRKGARRVAGTCACGAVVIEIDYPAFWAWHDHSAASRKVHGAAYATYIGCWKKKVRVTRGRKTIATFEDPKTGATRSFCRRCGTPVFYGRPRAAHMINMPRALFAQRTGREPRYHLHIDEMADFLWRGETLAPLKGYPGVFWERPRKAPRKRTD